MDLFNDVTSSQKQGETSDQKVDKLIAFGDDGITASTEMKRENLELDKHDEILTKINSDVQLPISDNITSELEIMDDIKESPGDIHSGILYADGSEETSSQDINKEKESSSLHNISTKLDEKDYVTVIKRGAKNLLNKGKHVAASTISNYQTWRILQNFEKGSLVETDDFDFLLWKNELMVYKYKGISSEVIIPDYVGNVPVTAIYKGFLSKSIINNHKLRGIGRYFSDHVSELSLDNLKSCLQGVHTVQLPICLKMIPDHAFTGCSNLLFIEIPESVKVVAPNAFKNSRIFQIFFSGTMPANFKYLNLENGTILYCREKYLQSFS